MSHTLNFRVVFDPLDAFRILTLGHLNLLIQTEGFAFRVQGRLVREVEVADLDRVHPESRLVHGKPASISF